MTVFLSAASGLAAPKPAGELRVRIYDYVSVEPLTLANAEQEASRLLRRAGVRVAWLDCEILREDRPSGHPCSAPLNAADIHLRIYDQEMAGRLRTHQGCVGLSFISAGFDTIGVVFYHRATELTRQLGIPLAPILGAVIAHEIGHLLLDDTRHANSGLMTAHWNDETLLRIFRNQLGFASAEKKRIAVQVALRIASDQQTGNLVASGSKEEDNKGLHGAVFGYSF